MKATIVIALCLVSISLCSGQNTKIPWGAFSTGYAKSRVENTAIHSVGGQTIAGSAWGSNTMIMSGFLADTLFQKILVAIGRQEEGVPGVYELAQNYPNPFNPRTVVRSQMPEASDVRLVIYDVLGREVKVLVNEKRAAGRYEDIFDGSGLASGVYYYRITAGKFVQTRAMVFLK